MALRTGTPIVSTLPMDAAPTGYVPLYYGKAPRAANMGGKLVPVAPVSIPVRQTSGAFPKALKATNVVKLNVSGGGQSGGGSSRPRGSYYWGL